MDVDKDALLGDYLLGKLPEEQATRLETEYLSNADLREQLESVEAELIDAYLKGELSRSDRRELETRFLASPRGQERLQFARTWIGSPPRTRAFSMPTTWLKPAAALAVVSLSATLVWMSMPREGGREIAAPPPPPAAPATTAPPATQTAPSRPAEHWTDLYAGISRGTSGANEVVI